MNRCRLLAFPTLVTVVLTVGLSPSVEAIPVQEPNKEATTGIPIAVPEGAALIEAQKLVRSVYKADYAKKKPADQAELARKFLKVASETKDDSTARYVLYREARDVAIKGGDVGLALEAVAAIGRYYVVDPIELKMTTLEAADRSQAVTHKAIVEAALDAEDEALQSDDFVSAARYLRVAGGRAKLAGHSLVVAFRQKELDDVRRVFEATEADRKTIQAKPVDPAAATRVGRFLCLMRGDWENGLKLLAQGDDEKLKVAAERDLARLATAVERTELADRWWDLVEGLLPSERTEARARAYYWYQLASPELMGLSKARADKRISELGKAIVHRVGRVGAGGWRLLFRSDDPSIWNSDTSKGQDHCAASLARVPADARFLRLKNVEKGTFVIIEMSKGQIGEISEQNGYGWNGANKLFFNGRHLGIYDISRGEVTSGLVSIHTVTSKADYPGWGFGHVTGDDDRQGYGWGGEKITKTLFEITVRTTPLSSDDAVTLLKKKTK